MATVNSTVSPFFSHATMTSPEMRYALAALAGKDPASILASEGGVFPTGAGAATPTSNGTASAPSVSVAPFQCAVERPTGGTYICTWPTAQTVALDLPKPSSGLLRIDLLVAEVNDPEADTGSTAGTTVFRVRTVAGTPAASPVAPSVPAGTVPLYQWRLNNAGTIDQITSRRSWTRAAGGVRPIDGEDGRNGSHSGDMRIWPTGRIDAWINSAWLTVVAPAAWTEIDVAWVYEGTSGGGTSPSGTVNFGAGSSSKCRYKRAGNDLLLMYQAVYGTGYDTGSGYLRTVLPAGMVSPARSQFVPCELWVLDPVSGTNTDYAGMAWIPPDSSLVYPYFSWTNNDTRIVKHLVQVTPGVPGQSRPLIPGGYACGGRISIGPGLIEVAS
jgi:hypothetical protein